MEFLCDLELAGQTLKGWYAAEELFIGKGDITLPVGRGDSRPGRSAQSFD